MTPLPVPRPRRNRLTPFGEIEAASVRGSLMGNRGILHDERGCLGAKRWQNRSWITCTLETQGGPKRPLAAPGHYTVLFFHDEAVAFAAGHRPCAQYRRAAYIRFVTAWKVGHGIASETFLPAKTIDAELHAARIHRGQQVTHTARLGDLPDGAFVTLPDQPGQPFLHWNDQLYPWKHNGYGSPQPAPADAVVTVMTPAPAVAVLQAGYTPEVAVAGPPASAPHSSWRDR